MSPQHRRADALLRAAGAAAALPMHGSETIAVWQRSSLLGAPSGGCRLCRRSARLALRPHAPAEHPRCHACRAGNTQALIHTAPNRLTSHPSAAPSHRLQCWAGGQHVARESGGRAAAAVAARCAPPWKRCRWPAKQGQDIRKWCIDLQLCWGSSTNGSTPQRSRKRRQGRRWNGRCCARGWWAEWRMERTGLDQRRGGVC